MKSKIKETANKEIRLENIKNILVPKIIINVKTAEEKIVKLYKEINNQKIFKYKKTKNNIQKLLLKLIKMLNKNST